MAQLIIKKRGRGRPKMHPQNPNASNFNPASVKLLRGTNLQFDESLFIPIKTNSELDILL